MTAVPAHDFEVPEIFVQDESESPHHAAGQGLSPATPIEQRGSLDNDGFFSPKNNVFGINSSGGSTGRATGISTNSPGRGSINNNNNSNNSGFGGESPASATGSVLRRRSDSIQISPSASPTRHRFRPSPTLGSLGHHSPAGSIFFSRRGANE